MVIQPAEDSSRGDALCILNVSGQAFRVMALENGYEYALLAGHPLGRSGFVTKVHGSDAALTLEDHVGLVKDWLEDDPSVEVARAPRGMSERGSWLSAGQRCRP